MESSRQEYPALLRSLSPNQAIAVLDERVRIVGKVNTDIADWLSERRRVEEEYIRGLKKLASRRPQDTPEHYGVFWSPWQSIISSVESLAQSHSLLANKIESDVERPLKEYQSKAAEMKAMTTIQGNIAAIAKEVDTAHKKVSKLNMSKSNANKVANASSDVEAANLQWDSQAPYAFETLQALDEGRVNHLRDVLTQLETHEVDQVERSRVSAETCLNALLNIDTSDEISTFVARTSAGGIPNAATLRQESRGSGSASAPSTAAEPPVFRATPSRPSAARPDDDSSGRPSPFAPSLRSGAGSQMAPPPQKSSFGGLRRLGTVLSRPGKSSKGMERMDRPVSPEKRSRPTRNPLRRGASSKQDMQTIPSPETSQVRLPSSPPQLDAPSFGNSRKDSAERPQTPTDMRRRNNQVNGETNGQTPKRSSTMPSTNGVQTTRAPVSLQDPQSNYAKPTETQRDAEGYSVPSSAVNDITRAQQEAAAAGESDQTGQAGLKLDIRSEPIHEEGPEAKTAFSSVANTLRAQAQQAATPRKSNTNRGRRDVRNTMFVPSGQSLESAGLGSLAGLGMSGGSGSFPPASASQANPAAPASSPIPTADTGRGVDAQSIRSAHSMSTTAHAAIVHPQMHQPGLNASVVETVSATFSQTQVTKAVVIGELALQHNAGDTALSSGSENIRLDNFPVLEKVAPNPTFITQKPSSAGEYTVNLSQVSRPTVAFKYQVHLEESNLAAHAPISITPNWRIEPTEARMILTYAFNPAFVSPAKRSVSLKNVKVSVAVEGAKAMSAQSKPAGTFKKAQSLFYWEFGDTELDAYAEAPHKLLVRFNTDGEAKPGNVEVRWEIDGEQAASLGSGLGLSTLSSAKEEGGSDPFADESAEKAAVGSWKEVPVTRRIISGKYMAQ